MVYDFYAGVCIPIHNPITLPVPFKKNSNICIHDRFNRLVYLIRSSDIDSIRRIPSKRWRRRQGIFAFLLISRILNSFFFMLADSSNNRKVSQIRRIHLFC